MTMKTKRYNFIKIGILSLLLTSCSDILDEIPDNRTTINSAEKIAELLVGAYPSGAYAPFLEPMSDNAGDKGPSAQEVRVNEDMFFWRDHNEVGSDTPAFYWNSAYAAIAQANQALVSIEELGGGIEFDALKGEALLCRAYTHFMLVNIFSKSYNPNTSNSDLGIPYVLEPETVLLKDYSRGTVASVYENIQKDLEKGLPLIEDNYSEPKFHFNKKAANTFASRFYLIIGEWQKVINHSTVALGGSGEGSLRDWENDYRPNTYGEQLLSYSSSNEPANLLLVSAPSTFSRTHASARYQLNGNKSVEIFPAANATGKPWSYNVFGSNDLVLNIPKFIEYFRVTNQAANTGFAYTTFVLFSTDEAILNRAEAYAMLGDFDNATADINSSYALKTIGYNATTDVLSVSDIATLFEVSDTSQFAPFYNVSAETLPFINAVLTIKRTIFYNEGMRWFDIKRYNMPVEHTDFNGNNYVLTKEDNRRQVQIPEAAQAFDIEKNPR